MTEIFDRYWKLTVKSVPGSDKVFNYDIKPDDFGNSLRITFDISATVGLRNYSGTINIYNLEPSKRKNLLYNLLLEKTGTGPAVQLEAGYKKKSGLIFDGAITRGYTRRHPESGDWVTTLQVNMPLSHAQKITIAQIKVFNASTLATLIKTLINTIRTLPNRVPIKLGPNFDTNVLRAANDYFSAGNTVNDMVGYSGPIIQVVSEVEKRFNLKIYYDHTGINVVSSDQGPVLTIPPGNRTPELTISQNNGLIGSPIYTDTGAKLITYLNPEYKMFQYIKVDSALFNRNISILSLKYTGDSMTNEWFSEIDGSQLNQEQNAA